MTNVAQEKLRSDMNLGFAYLNEKMPGDWSIQNGSLYKGNERVNENFSVVDEIGSLTGDTVTIFQGNIRAATNVKEADGTRAIGTTAMAIVEETTLKGGQAYFGEADVAGTINQTAYEPIKNAQGEIIGMWYVGVPNTPYVKMANNMRDKSLVLGIGELIVVIIILWFLVGRSLLTLQQVNKTVNLVAEGDLRVSKVKVKAKDEIGQIADAISNMTGQLNNVVKQLKERSQQVSGMNEALSSSVEKIFAQTQNISTTSQEIAAGMEENSGATQEVTASGQTILDLTNNLVEKANTGLANAKDISERA